MIRLGFVAFMFMLVACGFELRGIHNLSFQQIYIQGSTPRIMTDLKRSLANNGVKIVTSPEQADIFLEILGDRYEKNILSLNVSGAVGEFEIRYVLEFRLRDKSHALWDEPQRIQLRRTFSYRNQDVLGKEEEESYLAKDMLHNAVNEVLRHLSAVKI